ncbi:hypothetical protein [Streptomyces hiroshimensis]|uniref:hypothetical protein n=1 Tax=Streptomyces hiroshimensis TaxID=66424 RepID=UPI0016737DEF|nr:hypothetical protein [Streptomyces hiroshimensis]
MRSKLHGIPELTDSPELREKVIGPIWTNLKTDRDLLDGRDRDWFMMGVLEAKIGNKEHLLVASSGGPNNLPWITGKHLKGIAYKRGWTLAETPESRIAVPATQNGWRTVMGMDVQLAGVPVQNIGQPCAAVKLLLKLAELNTAHEKVRDLHISEQVVVYGDRIPPNMRQYHGKGADGSPSSTWTAHSCAQCEARIPYLICDVPANQILA